jgi:hypothetical protein
MRNHHHPRNLRRSFGSQPVVCVGRPSWSEAGIAAQVIPAQSSRWTSRGRDVGNLPTCRRADLVVDDSWGDRSRTLFRPQFRRFLFLQHQRRGICPNPTLQTTPAHPRLSNCPEVFSVITARHNLPQPLPAGNSSKYLSGYYCSV